MNRRAFPRWTRREFLCHLAVTGGAGLAGLYAPGVAAEPPLETTTIRITHDLHQYPTLCYGPQYVAEALLRLEGFTDIEYVEWPTGRDAEVVALGHADIGGAWVGDFMVRADRHGSVVALSGMHTGCAEVFAGERVRSFADLEGKRVAIGALDDIPHIFFSLIVAYIGLDPRRDIRWVELPYDRWGPALSEGEVDAILLWPPSVQEFKEKGIGRIIWNMTTDRPWRQFFCCMVIANRSFVEAHPIAAKRALRAMLKATDLCALAPERAARSLIETGFPVSYERALQVFREVPYSDWRDFDPIDTLRFYALRLHGIGMLAHAPETLVATSGEWRFLAELKRELKA